jgi:methylated-DNA-[protein]-cysteine S-methyltransferase
MTLTRTVPSPVGDLLLVGDGETLSGLYLPDHRPAPLLDAAIDAPDAFGAAVLQLGEWFAGLRTVFDLPLDLRGTEFQLEIWEALASIPYGRTATYGDVAAAVGRPKAARGAGHAIARNPVSIVIPCHRVLGSGGALTGYAGGVDRKRTLLELERHGLALMPMIGTVQIRGSSRAMPGS